MKLTGGQRIDLLGMRKDDLPKVWQDLDMPSGYAYGKSYRTCKSCVGSDFCRFGLGDSISLALKIENEFQGFDSPHKMKLATAGCPRNCSEAMVKDLGAVAVEGGKWEIYIGGAAGSSIRKGDILCAVDSHEDVLKYMGRFIQYYRENAKYLERTHGFVQSAWASTRFAPLWWRTAKESPSGWIGKSPNRKRPTKIRGRKCIRPRPRNEFAPLLPVLS